MSTPPPVPTPGVSLPPPIESSSSKGGCWKYGVIGCGAAAVVVVLVVIAFLLYVSRRPESMFDLGMTAMESNFAPDVTEEDKRELRAAYQEFRAALKEKRVDQRQMGSIGRAFRVRAGEPISREQVHRMTELFRNAARSGPATTPAAVSTAVPLAVTP